MELFNLSGEKVGDCIGMKKTFFFTYFLDLFNTGKYSITRMNNFTGFTDCADVPENELEHYKKMFHEV